LFVLNIPIFNTFIDENAFLNVNSVLETTFLSEGKLVKEFENQLAENLQLINPIAVNSGTSALHLALVLSNIGEGDEVITPAQTFVATGLVVLQQGAKVVFADIDYNTGNISLESIKAKTTSNTKAIILVHWGGYPCDLDEINNYAKSKNIVVIEDAAHALGATYKGRAIGSISDYTCFSFQAIKHLTTGDGGAICSRNAQKQHESIVRRWFGIDRSNAELSHLGERLYDIKEIGYKYHLNDYGAALGLSNLVYFKNRLEARIEIANYYRNNLQNVSGIELFNYNSDRQSAYWLFGFHVEHRDAFISALKDKGIVASVVHLGIDHNTIFGGYDKTLVNQRKFDDSQIHIPIHDEINMEKAEYIVDVIKKGW
jgi:perosamine synthetase